MKLMIVYNKKMPPPNPRNKETALINTRSIRDGIYPVLRGEKRNSVLYVSGDNGMYAERIRDSARKYIARNQLPLEVIRRNLYVFIRPKQTTAQKKMART